MPFRGALHLVLTLRLNGNRQKTHSLFEDLTDRMDLDRATNLVEAHLFAGEYGKQQAFDPRCPGSIPDSSTFLEGIARWTGHGLKNR